MMLISVGNNSYLDTINLMLLLPTVRAVRQLLYSPGNGCLCFTACCKSVCRCLYCTNTDFMTRWSLASLKLTIDDVMSTEMGSYM